MRPENIANSTFLSLIYLKSSNTTITPFPVRSATTGSDTLLWNDSIRIAYCSINCKTMRALHAALFTLVRAMVPP